MALSLLGNDFDSCCLLLFSLLTSGLLGKVAYSLRLEDYTSAHLLCFTFITLGAEHHCLILQITCNLQPFMSAWSSGFDKRVAAASAAEGRMDQHMHGSQEDSWARRGRLPTKDQSPTLTASSSHHRWAAPPRAATGTRQPDGWLCGGKDGCGYRKNQDNQCHGCSAPWGHWRVVQRTSGHFALSNSFLAWQDRGPLEHERTQLPPRGGPLVPPWKQTGKGRVNKQRGGQAGHHKTGKGKGKDKQQHNAGDDHKSPTTPADDEEMLDYEIEVGWAVLKLHWPHRGRCLVHRHQQSLLCSKRWQLRRKGILPEHHCQTGCRRYTKGWQIWGNSCKSKRD